jgi:hypothetical protein
MASKPWRTVIISEETGRFTREQLEAAVLAGMAHTEAKKLRKAKAAAPAKAKAAGAPVRSGTVKKRELRPATPRVRKAASRRAASAVAREVSRKEPAP